MEIHEYQMDKLEEARRVQQECLRLHMPPPPVLHWGFEVKAANGEVVRKGRGKANSYTRNALNLLASNLGFAAKAAYSSTVADGYIQRKDVDGEVYASSSYPIYVYTPSSVYVQLGSGSETESLDTYAMAAEISTDWTIGTTQRVSSFVTSSRKLVTILTRAFTNNTGASVDITEAAVRVRALQNTTCYALFIYDALSAITVADGETITWTYTTEVAYPNP